MSDLGGPVQGLQEFRIDYHPLVLLGNQHRMLKQRLPMLKREDRGLRNLQEGEPGQEGRVMVAGLPV